MANQLRAHLQTTLPGAIGLFRDIDSPISLAFLTRFPTQAKAAWLSPLRLQTWLRSAGYFNPNNAPALHTRLVAAPRGTTGTQATARAAVTNALVAALQGLRAQIKALEEQIAAQLDAHPDGHIFTSLPRAVASAPPDCWPRSATPEAATPHPSRWSASPAQRPPPDSPARSRSSRSDGPSTSSSAAPSPTSPATPTPPTPEPPTSTSEPASAATTTHTPSASSPEPGCTSSGAAGKTACPTTRPTNAPCNAYLQPPLDTGLLIRLTGWRASRVRAVPRISADRHHAVGALLHLLLGQALSRGGTTPRSGAPKRSSVTSRSPMRQPMCAQIRHTAQQPQAADPRLPPLDRPHRLSKVCPT